MSLGGVVRIRWSARSTRAFMTVMAGPTYTPKTLFLNLISISRHSNLDTTLKMNTILVKAYTAL